MIYIQPSDNELRLNELRKGLDETTLRQLYQEIRQTVKEYPLEITEMNLVLFKYEEKLKCLI